MAGIAKSSGKKASGFPSEATLRRMRNKLARVKGSRALPVDANLLDKAKYELCRQFVSFCNDQGVTQRELAERLGTNESRVSEIVRYHIHKLTLDRLVKYLEVIRPGATVRVA